MKTYIGLMDRSSLLEYSMRPARREDAEMIHELLIDVETEDQRGWVDTLDDRYRDFEDPDSDPQHDSLLVMAPDGRLAGLGWVFTPQEYDREQIVFLWGEVHPDYRQQGLGGFILNWMESRGRRILESRHALPQRVLRAACPEHLHDRVDLFTEHGFQHTRSSYRMRRALSDPIPEVVLPPGIEFHSWKTEYNEAALQTANEAFRDHWGYVPTSAESWNLWVTSHPSFRPDLTRLAVHGDQIVGLSINRVNDEEIQATGLKEGWIDDLAVLRPWRRQGIGAALLCAALRAFDEIGLEFAGLGVDTENTSGALRIYERLGFKVVKQFMIFTKAL